MRGSALAVLLASALGSAAPGAELLTPSGDRVKGEARISGGRLTIGDTRLAVAEIVDLRLSAGPWADTIDQGLVLAGGDILTGVVVSLQAGKIAFRSDSLGDLELRAGQVRAAVLGPQPLAGLGRPLAGGEGAVLVNGDFAAGSAEWINDLFVGINTGRRTIRLPRARTALVRLPSAEDAPAGRAGTGRAAEPRQYVRLVSGERLSGRVRSLSGGRLVLATDFAGDVTLPERAVNSLWSEGGAIVPLGSLEPAEVKQTPQFDESFPHRVDRSLSGGFLSVAGRRYERGIGCHSRCEIEYEIGGGYSALVAEIGIDDAARGRGEVVFRVLADGEVVFESAPVRGGEAARPIRVRLSRARRVRLVADFGADGASLGDHADWCRAVLVR